MESRAECGACRGMEPPAYRRAWNFAFLPEIGAIDRAGTSRCHHCRIARHHRGGFRHGVPAVMEPGGRLLDQLVELGLERLVLAVGVAGLEAAVDEGDHALAIADERRRHARRAVARRHTGLLGRHVHALHVLELELVVELLAGRDVLVDVERDEHDLALELAGELVPHRQLLRARLAPVGAGCEHDTLVLPGLELDRLAGGIDRDVEFGEPVADLEHVGTGRARTDQQRNRAQRRGEQRSTQGKETHRLYYRFTATSSSIHISMYLGCIGPSYLRSLKNKVGVESTPAFSACFRSLVTIGSAAS